MEKGKIILNVDQKADRSAYNKDYFKRPDIRARENARLRDNRKKITIEQKRERFISKGKPIPPKYMTDAELLAHKEANRQRKREAERKRLENPEYRERKRAKDRERLENKEVRARKRAMDRERAKTPDVSARKLEISKMFRGTDKYKEWARIHQEQVSAKHREARIIDNIGSSCDIVHIKCECCGNSSIKSAAFVGVSIVKSTHCNECAKGKRIPRTVEIICADCGDICQGNRRRRVCDPCAKIRFKDRKRNDPKEAARKKEQGVSLRSRARKHGAYMDTVNVGKVYERDKWRCVSCGCKVERTRHHQPNRATIDHRIPLSRGGSHTYENCQTMCVMCNSKKEASIPVNVQLSVFDMVR